MSEDVGFPLWVTDAEDPTAAEQLLITRLRSHGVRAIPRSIRYADQTLQHAAERSGVVPDGWTVEAVRTLRVLVQVLRAIHRFGDLMAMCGLRVEQTEDGRVAVPLDDRLRVSVTYDSDGDRVVLVVDILPA